MKRRKEETKGGKDLEALVSLEKFIYDDAEQRKAFLKTPIASEGVLKNLTQEQEGILLNKLAELSLKSLDALQKVLKITDPTTKLLLNDIKLNPSVPFAQLAIWRVITKKTINQQKQLDKLIQQEKKDIEKSQSKVTEIDLQEEFREIVTSAFESELEALKMKDKLDGKAVKLIIEALENGNPFNDKINNLEIQWLQNHKKNPKTPSNPSKISQPPSSDTPTNLTK
eukprot:TRINITY_DN938_c0_g1_i1.p1 TRINITY_DN938_c0_g1~~TRINITY_DN938_c0_g1_i1.p1  ORF type:complete len:237 (-),score=81.54 TRINITY_DN938_c0_g1_i1:68-745(-)